MLTAEIIAIGSELLTSERTDTNSLWLTERLNGIGIEVKLKTIVGDDITRKIAARAMNRRLLLNEKVLEAIRQKFFDMGRQMPEINSRQAMVIEGAEVLDN